jgi:hypothetical protein
MAGGEDLAVQAIERIAYMWRLDDTKIVRITRSQAEGFDWWPGDFCVRVRAQWSTVIDTVRLVIRTDVLKDVPITDELFISLVAEMSSLWAPTYAWVYPPAPFWEKYHQSGVDDVRGLSPRLGFSSSAYISSENVDWLTDFLARATILQPVSAQSHSSTLQGIFKSGVSDVSRSDTRKDGSPDEILNVANQVYVPRGKEPNRWIGTGEFQRFAEEWAQSDSCFGYGDATGLSAETPFGDDTALIRLWTDQKNPQLGNGLLATLQVPYSDDRISIAKTVAVLNLNESDGWTHFPLIGCWHPHKNRNDADGLAFSCFIPNSLYQPGLATQVAFWFLERARWVRKSLWPDMVDKTMMEIITSRRAANSRPKGH